MFKRKEESKWILDVYLLFFVDDVLKLIGAENEIKDLGHNISWDLKILN